MSVLARTTVLLILSNIFMTFAWYAHLRNLSDRKWWVTTLSVFVPFAILYMRQPVRLDFLWAGLCLLGAVYFIFRSAPSTP